MTAGSVVLRNISGTNANALHNIGNMTLGGLTIENISYTIGGDNQGNGVCNTGTLTLNGNVTINGVTTTSNTNDLKCHGILNKGTINLNGEITVSISNTSRGGIHMVGGSITGANATIRISNTAKTMLRMTSAASVNVKNIYCNTSSDSGIQLDGNCELTASYVEAINVPNYGMRLKNSTSSQPTVNVGTLVVVNCTQMGLTSDANITSTNLSIGTVYHYGCTTGVRDRILSGVGTVINENPLAAAAAGELAE